MKPFLVAGVSDINEIGPSFSDDKTTLTSKRGPFQMKYAHTKPFHYVSVSDPRGLRIAQTDTPGARPIAPIVEAI